jgi:hypothetical protein
MHKTCMHGWMDKSMDIDGWNVSKFSLLWNQVVSKVVKDIQEFLNVYLSVLN